MRNSGTILKLKKVTPEVNKVTLDKDNEIFRVSPICGSCFHWAIFNLTNGTRDKKCDAFPRGIPSEIWNGSNSHTYPYSGDNGIMFYEATLDEKIDVLQSIMEINPSDYTRKLLDVLESLKVDRQK